MNPQFELGIGRKRRTLARQQCEKDAFWTKNVGRLTKMTAFNYGLLTVLFGQKELFTTGLLKEPHHKPLE